MMQTAAAVICFAGLTACGKDDDTTPPATEVTQKEILASGSSMGSFTLLSLETGTIVPNTDSATAKWDLGIRLATIIINSNASGPGAAGVQVKDGTFESFTAAPETGYAYDTTAAKLALKGPEWYNYDPVNRTFSPKAGKTFLFKTAAGKYAKLEMLSADPTDDNGNAVVPPTRPTKIKYKMRIGYQRDGSRNLQ